MAFWRWGRGEHTSVDKSTELGIPLATYRAMVVYGNVGVVGGFVFCWLVWLLNYMEDGTPSRWWRYEFVPWWNRWWPLVPICVVVWTITIPLWPLLFRLIAEQIFKQWHPVDLWGWLFGRKKGG